MSLFLELPLVEEIKRRATAQGVKYKDVVTQWLRPLLLENEQYVPMSVIDDALDNSPFRDSYLLSQEQYDQIGQFLLSANFTLQMLHVGARPSMSSDKRWQEACADREAELIEAMCLWFGYNLDEAKAIVHTPIETLMAERNERFQAMYAEELRKMEEAREVSEVQEAPRTHPKGRKRFALRDLFRRRGHESSDV